MSLCHLSKQGRPVLGCAGLREARKGAARALANEASSRPARLRRARRSPRADRADERGSRWRAGARATRGDELFGESRGIKGDEGNSREITSGSRAMAECAAGRWRSTKRQTRRLRRGRVAAGCFETLGVVMDQLREPFATHGPFARRPVRAHAATRPAPSPERPALRRHSSLLDSRRVPTRGGLALLRGLAQAHLLRQPNRRNQMQSDAIRRHQTPSEAIRLAQAHRSVVVGRRPRRHRAG